MSLSTDSCVSLYAMVAKPLSCYGSVEIYEASMFAYIERDIWQDRYARDSVCVWEGGKAVLMQSTHKHARTNTNAYIRARANT